MTDVTIEDIELNIRQARDLVGRGDALDRLCKNADFLKIIQEGYFEGEAVRLVHLKANPAMQSEEKQADIVKSINAIGSLNQYFVSIEMQARMAEEAIVADEQTIEEMVAEGEV